MSRVSKPHAIVADKLPDSVGSGAAVRERLRNAGATTSATLPVERARVRLRDGRADVLVRRAESEPELSSVATAHGVPQIVVTDGDASADSAATIVSTAGPDPAARVVAAVHELAADTPAAGVRAASTAPMGSDETSETDERRMPPSAHHVLDEAPVGITVSDVTRPDEPLVYVNDKFVEQTGYERAEVLGRNCRFLQGPATEPEPVARMRAAIDAGESVTVEIQNYRKDGRRFWQAVSLAPIHGESGEVTHFAGFQKDITRRKRAERAADHHRAKLADEREALQRLLQRLDGVLERVTRAVVEAESRDGLGETVCERLGESYAAAWLGEYEPARDRVTPEWTTAPGLDQDPGASLGSVALDDAAVSPDGGTAVVTPRPEPELLARAVRTGEVTTSGDERTAEFGQVAAVPVTYFDSVLGLLCVYTGAESSFDDEEVAVLASVGRTVGIGLDSIDSRAALVADDGVRVEVAVGPEATPLVRLAARANCRLRRAGVVPDDDGQRLLCTVSGADAETVQEAAAAIDGIDGCDCLAEGDTDPLFAFDVSSFPLLDAVAGHGLELADLRVDGTEATIVAHGSREVLARAFVDDLTAQYDSVDLRGFQERSGRPETLSEFVVDVEERLTDRQRRALVVANAAGYFEWPRDTTGDELAEQFGVARSTFHQHLRAALRKLVGAYDEAADTGEGRFPN